LVFIARTLNKDTQPVFRCALGRGDSVATLEVPQWMFDPAVCCRTAMGSNPSVNVEALRELQRLLTAITRTEPSPVVEAEHLAMQDRGGACEISESAAADRPAGVVPSEGESPDVVHAVANTPAQRLGSSLLDHPAVSVFPGSSTGSTCAFSFSRLARRSLALRPAHSRRHQSRDALHQRLRLLRYLHSRSGCFRLEHSPGGTLTHWKTPPFHGAPAIGKIEAPGLRAAFGPN
jgi:hypothetical protein